MLGGLLYWPPPNQQQRKDYRPRDSDSPESPAITLDDWDKLILWTFKIFFCHHQNFFGTWFVNMPRVTVTVQLKFYLVRSNVALTWHTVSPALVSYNWSWTNSTASNWTHPTLVLVTAKHFSFVLQVLFLERHHLVEVNLLVLWAFFKPPSKLWKLDAYLRSKSIPRRTLP